MADIELALLIDRLMRRIHGKLRVRAPQFDVERIGPGGALTLLTLADMEGASIRELTRRLGRDKSQMTRTLHSLEAKGLIVRNPSPHDARVTTLDFTDKGRTVLEQHGIAMAEAIDEILEPISDQERDVLRGLLLRVVP